ncbi:MAG: hypothetical protein ABI550_10190 [Ignavibacteriaceae bacterium]
MNGLKLENFISSEIDFELNQYKVLDGLKSCRLEFNKKKIYPSLSNLISLVNQLHEIINQKSNLEVSFPKIIKEYDIKNKKIIFEKTEKINANIEFLFNLIEWSLPKIKEVIEEGLVVYEFVEKNLDVKQVGVVPLYKSEGYFIIPDNIESILQIHQFECSLFSSDKEKYRTLKTKFIKTLEHALIEESPESIKIELIKEFEILPNPATFICETDLDFPFSETIFPIAKRKLMVQLAA